MNQPKRTMVLAAAAVFALVGLAQIALESYAEARAGGGASGGSRGSRSYQAPASPSQPSPFQSRREASPPPQGPQPGGFMRGLAGGIIGGFLGSLLFSGMAHAGWGGGLGGSGFGLLEILLIAGAGYFIYRKFLAPAVATGSGAMQYQKTGDYVMGNTPAREDVRSNDLDFGTILMMDRSFDPTRFLKTAQELFFKIQGAWNRRDTAALGSNCGSGLMQTWQQELAKLGARGQTNRMENIALSSSEITEAWAEAGQDYITVRFQADLLDYTVDETSGAVVEGSNSEPVEFEEFWTFSRPVGPNPWKLSAVQQEGSISMLTSRNTSASIK
jgi:predicted lipid-binding transport protein (Tim44 family)